MSNERPLFPERRRPRRRKRTGSGRRGHLEEQRNRSGGRTGGVEPARRTDSPVLGPYETVYEISEGYAIERMIILP